MQKENNYNSGMQEKRDDPDRERKIREFQRNSIGERFIGKSLHEVRMGEMESKKILKFIKSPKNFLIFCGNSGIGKTHLCSALIPWAHDHFDTYRFWHEQNLFQAVRKTMDEYHIGDYSEALRFLTDDQLVILNDVGSMPINKWRADDIFFSFVDNRYNSMLPTIITSNFSLAEFKEVYKERICSRLFASENTIIEILDGVDLRTQGL